MKKLLLISLMTSFLFNPILKSQSPTSSPCDAMKSVIKLMDERKYSALFKTESEKPGESDDIKEYDLIYPLDGFKESKVQKYSFGETVLYRVHLRTHEKYSKIANDIFATYEDCFTDWERTEDLSILEDDIGDNITAVTYSFKKGEIEIECVVSVGALYSEIVLNIDRLNQ